MYYISDFCHLCLKDDTPLIDLSKNQPENRLISYKLGVCVSELKWSTSKCLLICKLCVEKLEAAYDFKQTCVKSIGILNKRLTILNRNGKSISKLAKLHVPLPKESISMDKIQKYLTEQNNMGTAILNQIDNSQVVYTPSLIIANGQQASYQNIFLNFVSTNNMVYPFVTNQPVLMNVNKQSSPTENDAILKQLLETKDAEEVSVDIDPSLYDFEHFLTSPVIQTPNIECATCGTSYTTIKGLRKHFDEVHGGDLPYFCTYCFSKFLLKEHLDKHMRIHMENNTETLAGSTINLDNLSKMSQCRIQGNDVQNEYKCKECAKIFDSSISLGIHAYNVHNGEKPDCLVNKDKLFNCDVCKGEFVGWNALEQHLKLHQRRKRTPKNKKVIVYKDPGNDDHYGGNDTNDSNSVKENISVQLFNYKGQSTQEEVASESAIHDHWKNIKGTPSNKNSIKQENNDCRDMLNEETFKEYLVEDAEGNLSCRFCKIQFPNKPDLQKHLTDAHVKEIQYHCHMCNEKFADGFRLKRHLRIHYHSFSCTECIRSFRSIPEITNHVTHSHDIEMTSIDCNVCFANFTDVDDLKEHMERHLTGLVYKCHICEEKFRECRYLKKHIADHNGMTPCETCSRMFYKEAEWKEHNDECAMGSYKCEFCPRKFKVPRSLKRHVTAMHTQVCVDEEPPKKKEKSSDEDV